MKCSLLLGGVCVGDSEFEGVVKIGDDVRNVLDSDRDLLVHANYVSAIWVSRARRNIYTYSEKIRSNTRGELLIGRQLLMRGGSWVDDEGLGIT